MEIQFTPVEIRVLGCLVEKESTTPETYPLTLNALTRACNQKSNREPVMELSEATVLDALEALNKRMLVSSRSGSDSRVSKYSHRLRDRRSPEFDFAAEELAVICVLLLRGPQTPGEIRTRSDRLFHFQDTAAILSTLQKLQEREDGPYVKQLARQPGQKEARYMHLFAGDIEEDAVSYATTTEGAGSSTELQARVGALEVELAELQQRFQEFVKQFE